MKLLSAQSLLHVQKVFSFGLGCGFFWGVGGFGGGWLVDLLVWVLFGFVVLGGFGFVYYYYYIFV